MSERDDELGFYRTLGVSSDADQEQIRSSYRELIKKHHPDRDKGQDAVGRFQAIRQAYEVLGNPQLRASYDAWSRKSDTGQEPPSELFPLITCERCGRDTPYLRIILVHWVWSALLFTRRGYSPLLVCSSCGAKSLGVASIKTAVVGWWGFPFGLFLTPVAIWKNLLASPEPREANVRMLIHQAVAYAQRNNLEDSQRARLSAEQYARGDVYLWSQVAHLGQHLPKGDNIKLKDDPWRLFSPGSLPRLSGLLVAAFIVFGIGSLVNRDIAFSDQARAICENQQEEIETEKARLSQVAADLKARDEQLSARRDQINMESSYIDSDLLNSHIESYNFDLLSHQNGIHQYNLDLSRVNTSIEEYNSSCAS